MIEMASPYDDLIMDHIKNARNYYVLDDVIRVATGANVLCGDELTLYLKIESERIAKIAFQCTSCGISMASASIMTEMVKGMDTHGARNLSREFVVLLGEKGDSRLPSLAREPLAVIEAARKFPSRNRCAALPWATLGGRIG